MAWRRSKYNSVKTEVDGILFDSKGEAARYRELKLLLAAGEIRDLWRQVRYHFILNDVKVCTYICDFEYEQKTKEGQWLLVSEDFKGFRTAMFRIKAKLFRAFAGRTLLETGRG